MGQAQGRVDAQEQSALMEVQRNYVNVRLEQVDFSNPTGADEANEEDDEEDDGGGKGGGGKGEEDAPQTVEEDVTYEAYKPAKLRIPGMKRHPSDAVENGTLATAAPPDVTRGRPRPPSPFLPRERERESRRRPGRVSRYELAITTQCPRVVKDGRLSDLQLEFVTYACQRHETDLHSGSRAGFFLGDGAGMGKGRQLAGLILENCLRGRKKHVWVSTNIDLREDAARDLADVGVDGFDAPKPRPKKKPEADGDAQDAPPFTLSLSRSSPSPPSRASRSTRPRACCSARTRG